MSILAPNRFSRDLVMDVRRNTKDPNLRRQRTHALYQKFGATEVWFDGKLIGWQVGQRFHCYKKSFPSEQDAKLMLDVSVVRTRGRTKANEVYQCPKCGQWHATSQGHLAGTRKKVN